MSAAVSTPSTTTVPARFLGIQPGFGPNPAIELYTLLSPVGPHPVGSAVSRQTLERHGYFPGEIARPVTNWPVGSAVRNSAANW